MQTLSVEESPHPKTRTPQFWGRVGAIALLVLSYPVFVGARYMIAGDEKERAERDAMNHIFNVTDGLERPRKYATYVPDANGKMAFSLPYLAQVCKDTPDAAKEYVPQVAASIGAALQVADAECKQLAQKGLRDPSSLTETEIKGAAQRINLAVDAAMAPAREMHRLAIQKQAEQELQKILR